MLLAFLVALATLLHVTDFFRNKRSLATLLLDWRYWVSDSSKIFDYNYYGIAGVAIFIVVVILPLLFFLCKKCFGIMRIEKELVDVRDELKQIKSCDGVKAVARGGWINIAIGNCFNVYCNCYITTTFTSTALVFMGVTIFVCYVLYRFLST